MKCKTTIIVLMLFTKAAFSQTISVSEMVRFDTITLAEQNLTLLNKGCSFLFSDTSKNLTYYAWEHITTDVIPDLIFRDEYSFGQTWVSYSTNIVTLFLNFQKELIKLGYESSGGGSTGDNILAIYSKKNVSFHLTTYSYEATRKYRISVRVKVN